MDGDRARGRVWAALCGLLLVVAAVLLWRGLRHAKLGDVDPLSGALALVALVFAIGAGRQSARAQRLADTDVDRWADELAREVATSESAQRRQLLSGQADPIDVEFVFTPETPHDARGARPVGSLSGVIGYFRDLDPQRLVITGPPGAGKTVLAIELILGLLEKRTGDEPVPVRIPAASWDPEVPVERWLADHLGQTFRLPESAAKALVEAHRVLPVIDGLDEMDAEIRPGHDSRAGRALEALNGYQRFRARARMVLTCRSEEYEALTARNRRARDAARVGLVPVSPDKAWAFISAVTDADPLPRWQPVLDALTQDGHPLAAALGTPWRLTLAVTVYEERDPVTDEYLRDPGDLVHTDAERIHRHLLDLFIPAATAAATRADRNPHGYRPDQVRAWLTVLARYLNGNADRPPFAGRVLSSTDLVLHELWPLAGNGPRLLAGMTATMLVAVPPIGLAVLGTPLWFVGLPSIGMALAVSRWFAHWPDPTRVDLSWLRNPEGRRRVAGRLVFGLVTGLVAGLVSGFAIGLAIGLLSGLAVGLPSGLAGGLLIGLMRLRASALVAGANPRDPVRADVVGWLMFGLAAGLALGLRSGPGGFVFGFVFGLAFGLAGGPVGGPSGGRYLALVVSMRGWLPVRLGRFLDWACTAGLVRTAGIAYQFRHLDLQNHLAVPEAAAAAGSRPEAGPVDRS